MSIEKITTAFNELLSALREAFKSSIDATNEAVASYNKAVEALRLANKDKADLCDAVSEMASDLSALSDEMVDRQDCIIEALGDIDYLPSGDLGRFVGYCDTCGKALYMGDEYSVSFDEASDAFRYADCMYRCAECGEAYDDEDGDA